MIDVTDVTDVTDGEKSTGSDHNISDKNDVRTLLTSASSAPLVTFRNFIQ